jgi:hypothetical protein
MANLAFIVDESFQVVATILFFNHFIFHQCRHGAVCQANEAVFVGDNVGPTMLLKYNRNVFVATMGCRVAVNILVTMLQAFILS